MTNIRESKEIAFRTITAIAAPQKQQESVDGSQFLCDIYNIGELLSIQYQQYNYSDLVMAYLDREQSIRAWATIVTGMQVTNLRKIQQPEFICLLLSKLDSKYFQNIFSKQASQLSVSQIYKIIIKYYKTEIGTNIKHIIGEQINIYSNNNIEDAWQLMLGIAVKGNNRQTNINQILRMDGKNQQQLGRIVSKVITMFGENVSQISNQSNIISHISGQYANNDIFFEISEQNEQLKQRIDEQSQQIKQLKQNLKSMKKQLDGHNKFKKSMMDIMISENTATSFNYHYSLSQNSTNQAVIIDFFKDVLQENNYKSSEISKKEQKIHYYEQNIKDLKLAYSTILIQLQQSRKQLADVNTHTYTQQNQLQQLRKQNQQLMQRQRQWIQKIQELNDQKFYLKGIVQRLQKQNNFTPQKIDQLIALKIKQRQVISKQVQDSSQIMKKQSNNLNIYNKNGNKSEKWQKQQQIASKTIRYQIDETKQPSMRNKLQRQISHLQKKLNNITSQNNSLKKINQTLQNIINDFTKESQQTIKNMEIEYQSTFVDFEKQIKERVHRFMEETKKQKDQQDKYIEQVIDVIDGKIKQWMNKQKQYQSSIQKLIMQRQTLMKYIKNGDNAFKNTNQNQIISSSNLKIGSYLNQSNPKQQIKNIKVQQQPKSSSQLQSKQQQHQQQQQQHQNQQQQQQQIFIKINPSQQTICNPSLIYTPAVSLNVPNSQNRQQIMGSIIIHQDQDQEIGHNRSRQYSYMGNRQSYIQDQHLQFNEKIDKNISGIDISSYMNIGQQDEEYQQDMLQITDVSQLQEQLQKIKNRYLKISKKNEQLYKQIYKGYQAALKQKRSSQNKLQGLIDQIKNQKTGQNNKQETGENKFKMVTNIEDTPQFIKICHQNRVLKNQLSTALKQRNLLNQKLSQQACSEHNNQTNTQILQKSYNLIKQLKSCLTQTNTKYIQLYNYFTNPQNINRQQPYKIIQAQQIRIVGLQQQLQQKKQQLQNIIEQNKLMLNTLLEYRNIATRNSLKNNILQTTKQPKKVIKNKQEQLNIKKDEVAQITNRSRNRTINLGII